MRGKFTEVGLRCCVRGEGHARVYVPVFRIRFGYARVHVASNTCIHKDSRGHTRTGRRFIEARIDSTGSDPACSACSSIAYFLCETYSGQMEMIL